MGLARAAERAGLAYPDLLQAIIKAAFEGPPYDMHLPIFKTAGEGRALGR